MSIAKRRCFFVPKIPDQEVIFTNLKRSKIIKVVADEQDHSSKKVIPPQTIQDDEEDFEMVSIPDDEDSEIQQRADDIEQLAGDFILGLCGLEDSLDIGDMMEPESLAEFITMVELLLYTEYGIDIYRPRVITDSSGIEHVVNCLSEEEELS